ncbi:SIMPL domain-containing protein [Dactylosporangium roseum]|uniref:SIMPL domain-containing protein n=1 Tax=Dactylosporangium roseum TaxID=47989 RepID=A0ABY5YWI4_9ACTN|nr:SIMPL domain-containing protein [Dactylosporangium roseum]UWZ34106.1 SIMPL domain-containing protein [Dactylosporangium roseum]
MTTVVVRGEAVRDVEPELAEFTVIVAARDKDRQAALARLRERADALRQFLDRYAEAIERRESGGLHVHPENARRGEKVTAYAGSVSTTVTVNDLTVLGELMLSIADQDQTHVYGPAWRLRDDSPVHRAARRAAIGEAIARAKEYAEALGARVETLVELADPGLSRGPQPVAAGFETFAAQAKHGGPGGAPDLRLDPERQRVFAAVEARFTISDPTVL